MISISNASLYPRFFGSCVSTRIHESDAYFITCPVFLKYIKNIYHLMLYCVSYYSLVSTNLMRILSVSEFVCHRDLSSTDIYLHTNTNSKADSDADSATRAYLRIIGYRCSKDATYTNKKKLFRREKNTPHIMYVQIIQIREFIIYS